MALWEKGNLKLARRSTTRIEIEGRKWWFEAEYLHSLVVLGIVEGLGSWYTWEISSCGEIRN